MRRRIFAGARSRASVRSCFSRNNLELDGLQSTASKGKKALELEMDVEDDDEKDQVPPSEAPDLDGWACDV